MKYLNTKSWILCSMLTLSILSGLTTLAAAGWTGHRIIGGEGGGDAKNGTIKGVVKTNDGKPAASVSVQVKGRNKATLTDDDGNFTLGNLKPGNYELQVSLVGYETVVTPVTVEDAKTATVSILLLVSELQLQEVTVKSGRSPYNARNVSQTLRLNEPLLEAPQNIQVITNKVLTDQQIISMSDGLIRNVSGAMRLEHWADMYTNINMRGSRASAFRNGMNTIISYWSPLTEDMSFVDHVEFVKGPAGFMMSVGDPAGIYNVVTKKPTGVTKGEVSVTAGSWDLMRATADLDGKLDKEGKLLYRFNISGQTKNSFRPYEYNNRYSIAPVLSYKLDENTTLTAEYVIQKVKSSDNGSYYVFSPKGYAALSRDFTTLDPGIEPTYITDQSITIGLQHKFNANWKLTAQAAYYDYKGQGTTLWPATVNDSSAVGPESMIRGVGIWDAAATAKYVQAFVNGDIQTGAIHHRILGGLDVSDKQYMADWNQSHNLDTEDAQFVYASPDYGAPSNGYPVWDRTTPLAQRAGIYATVAQSYAGVYVQDELGFFDNKLRVTVAGRFSHVKTNDYNSFANKNKVTPRFGLSYSVDENTAVYGLYDQTFVPQTGFRKDGKSVLPLTGSNLEAGVKREWAGGKWSTTLSAYRILNNNANSSDPSDPTGKFIVQLGQTKAQGIEFDLRGELLPGLTMTANYALTDSKITRTDSSEIMKATIGNKVPGFAKHTANAWLNYKLTSGALKGLGISGGVTFYGERSTWSWNGGTGLQQLPDYTKFDGGIFWEQDKLRISCNVYNLADKYLYSGGAEKYSYTGSTERSYYYWQADPPRNWRLQINYRF